MNCSFQDKCVDMSEPSVLTKLDIILSLCITQIFISGLLVAILMESVYHARLKSFREQAEEDHTTISQEWRHRSSDGVVGSTHSRSSGTTGRLGSVAGETFESM